MTKNLTAAEVREWLDYDPATGVLTWKKNPRPRGKNLVGQRAGCLAPNGYRVLRINRILHREHAVAWLCMHGVWPGELDHKNRDPSDNRIANLRFASSRENKLNSQRAPNITGYRGVSYTANKMRVKPFRARLHYQDKEMHLGVYATAEEAHAAVMKRIKELDPDFVDPALWVYK